MWNEDGQPVLHGIKDAAAGGLQIVLSWILETSNLEIIKKEGQQRRVKSSGLQEKKKEKQTKKQKKKSPNKTTQKFLYVADSCAVLRNLLELYSERQHPFFLFTQQHFTAHIRQAQGLCLAMEICHPKSFAWLLPFSLITCLAVDWWLIWRFLVPHAHVFSCLLHLCRCFSHLPGSLHCPPDDF